VDKGAITPFVSQLAIASRFQIYQQQGVD